MHKTTKTAFKGTKSLFFTYCLWLSLLYLSQNKMMFPRTSLPEHTSFKIPKDVESSFLKTHDGASIEYWFIPSKTANAKTIVIFHGNATSIDFTYQWVSPLKKMGLNILLPEYRGYGRSQGSPNQAEIHKDTKSILKVLAKAGKINLDKLIYFGESLGGGVALHLASSKETKPLAIILRSTFLSGDAMAKRYFAPAFLLKNRFRNDLYIKGFDGAVFLAHGTKDRVIPISHSKSLASLAKNPSVYWVDADHNNFPLDERFWQQIERFIQENT